MEYTQIRDNDFLKAYRREIRLAWEGGEAVDSEEVLLRALQGGAPQFYVGFDYARRGVGQRLRRRLRPRHRLLTVKRQLWEDLTQRVRDEVVRSDGRLSVSDALARVLAEGNAPRFYIGPRTARRILSRMKNMNKQ